MKTFRLIWRSLFPVDDSGGNATRIAVSVLYLLFIGVIASIDLLGKLDLVQCTVNLELCTNIKDTYVNVGKTIITNCIMFATPLTVCIYGLWGWRKYISRRAESNRLSFWNVAGERPSKFILSFTWGLMGWGVANILWLVIQFWKTKDPLNEPPMSYGYDFAYMQMEIGLLLALLFLYPRINPTAKSLGSSVHQSLFKVRSFIIMMGWSVIFIGMVVAVNYFANEKHIIIGTMNVILDVLYAVLDGMVLALLVDMLYLTKQQFDGDQILRSGIRMIAWAWSSFLLAAFLYTLGTGVVENSPLHFTVGSIYDFIGLLSVICLAHGYLYLHYHFSLEHPNLQSFPFNKQELIKYIVFGYSNTEIRVCLNSSNTKAVQNEITKLYKEALFSGDDRSKRNAFISYYRDQVRNRWPAEYERNFIERAKQQQVEDYRVNN